MAWEQEWSDNHADTDMPPVTALQLWTITDQAAVTCTQSNTPLGARADRFMTNALVGQYMTCAGWPESSLEFAESKTVKDQRQRLLSSDTLPEQTAAALWTGPRSAGTHCLEPQNNTLTTLDYFASQRCGFEALYENTPNPHWIFRTIQYVLISSPTRKFLWQCTAEETTCCRATAESYFKSF